MFVQAIVFAPLCRFVTDRLQNHSVARAGRPKLLNDCVHLLLEMPLRMSKALIAQKNKQRYRETKNWDNGNKHLTSESLLERKQIGHRADVKMRTQ